MSVSVGELFVNLGVKGTDKTVQAFTSVKSGLGDMASMSLEAKAGIAALFYGIQQLFSASMHAGANIGNLSASLGINQKALQQWAGAAEAAGASSDSVFSAFQKIQNIMTTWQRGGGAPPSLGILLGGIGKGAEEFRNDANDLSKVMGDLSKFAQNKNIPQGLKSQILSEWGAGGLIGPMTQGKFNSNELSKVPFLSEGENKALAGMNTTFSRIETQWQKGLAKMIADGGPQLTKDIQAISTSLLELIKALNDLAKASHFIDLLTKFVGVFTFATNAGTQAVHDSISGDKTNVFGKSTLFGKYIDFRNEIDTKFFDFVKGNFGPANNGDIFNQYFYGPTDADDVKDAVKSNPPAKQSRKQTK